MQRPINECLPLQLKEIRDYKRNALTPGQPPNQEPEEESEEDDDEGADVEEEEEDDADVTADEEEVQFPIGWLDPILLGSTCCTLEDLHVAVCLVLLKV